MSLKSIVGTVVVLVAVCCGGCSADEPTPSEKCDRLVELSCTKVRACYEENGFGAAGSQSDCVEGFKQQLPCGKAVSVDKSYDDCLQDLEALSCARAYPVKGGGLKYPSNCQPVIYFPG